MIELRGVVAVAGMRPVSAVVRAGEVVRIEGPAAAVSALMEVMAGRRTACAGEIVRRREGGGGAPAVLVRRGERMVGGVEPEAALALWAALAGGQWVEDGGERESVTASGTAEEKEKEKERSAGSGVGGVWAARRGRALRVPLWLVDGGLEPAVEAAIERAAEDVRAGAGVMMWTAGAGRERVDRVIVVEVGAGRAMARAAGPARTRSAVPWRAIGRFAAAAVISPGATAIGAIAAAWLALAAATVAAHEGFWFAEGGSAALERVATIGAVGASVAAAVAAAARAAAAPGWPAMLRETEASAAARTLALIAGDVGGAVLTSAVAAMPAVWAMRGPGTFTEVIAALGATLMAAGVAGAVTRLARGVAMVGALVGAGGASLLLW